MPDDRLIHRKFGRGQRASQLTHFEFRVWVQYLVSSDDYGVMLFSVAPIQSDNVVLAKERPAAITKALKRLVDVGLCLSFEHQGLRYLCAPDWQDFQKVRYPRESHQPCPSAEIIEQCEKNTRELFARHPRNSSEAVPEDSGNIPETDQSLPRARTHETANGLRLEANGLRPTANAVRPFRSKGAMGSSPADHIGHAKCNDRGVCIPTTKFLSELLGRFGNDAVRFEAFYNGVIDSMPDDYVPTKSVFAFWLDMLARAFPEPVQAKPSARTAAMQEPW